jgi:hypothetical protein
MLEASPKFDGVRVRFFRGLKMVQMLATEGIF